MAGNGMSRRQMLATLGVAGVASIGLVYGRETESHASVIESVYSGPQNPNLPKAVLRIDDVSGL
ncbi:MAG: hypothetical protein K0R28_6849, partial [Paenibacillus sp.]|nr:hypothetical protein [Paenibacillus sp.]